MAPPDPAWRWPRFDPGMAAKVLLGYLAVGAVNASWIVVEFRAERIAIPWSRPFLWELTGTFAAFLAFPIVLTAALNAPRPRGRWGRFLGLHFAAYLLYALVIPAIFLAIRYPFYALMGWGPYDYGPLVLKLPMEWIKQLVGYTAITFAISAWLNFREAQDRARREVELRGKLQEARLQALSAQLDPHFLFNALNTISAVMYEDLAKTDALLATHGQMLRDSLEAGGANWTLQRELQHLDAFLAFAEVRFGDRLRVQREIEPGLGAQPVPRFCVQRLVENALKHNQDDPGRVLNLRLAVGTEAGLLRFEVEDDGGGFPDPGRALEGAGMGLRNLGDVLALQYAGRALLEAGNLPVGGAKVVVRIPREPERG